MKVRSIRPSAHQAQTPDTTGCSKLLKLRDLMRKSAVSALVAGAVIMLSPDVYFGAAEARDRDGRERASDEARRSAEREQERERERSREQEQARERERDAAKRAAETQRERSTSEPSKDTGSASLQDDRQSKSSNDDDEKKRSDRSSAQPAGKARAEIKASRDDELPRTVQEMFQRWSKTLAPNAEKPDDGDARRKDAGRTDADRRIVDGESSGTKNPTTPKSAAPPAKAAAEKSARPNVGAVRLPTDIVADFKRVEVLALNSNPQAIARAKTLGFATGPATRFSRLDLSLTKLIAPDGMSASQAQALLSSAAIGDFKFNRRYRIYRTATGSQADTSRTEDRTRPPVAMSTPCGSDRCYGAAILGWRPEFSGCAGTARIGVIDTAIDSTHHAFNRRRMDVQSFGRATTGKSTEWHGTGVLALLAGDPASDTPGLVHDAHFLVANAFFTDDEGLPSTDTLSLLAALDWLDRQKADIVNMSLAGPPDDLLRDALARLAGKGMIFVAAAGNEGPTAPATYPAAYPSVIAVTAVGRDLRSYRYANRGEHIDIAAPGVQIWTAVPGAKSGYHSGTSFAAPFATATIAAMLPPAGQRSKNAVLQRLEFKDLGEPGRDPVYGNGLLVGPATCANQTIASSGGSALGASPSDASIRKPPRVTATATPQIPPPPEKLPWR